MNRRAFLGGLLVTVSVPLHAEHVHSVPESVIGADGGFIVPHRVGVELLRLMQAGVPYVTLGNITIKLAPAEVFCGHPLLPAILYSGSDE